MKKVVIGIILLILLLGFGYIFYFGRGVSNNETVDVVATPTESLPTISDSTKVDLVFGSNSQSVSISISSLPAETENVEYELTYVTGSGLPRGVLGKISVKDTSSIQRDDIVLGTCSSGKCVYDTGVKSVNLSLKFNSSNGSKVYQKTYSI